MQLAPTRPPSGSTPRRVEVGSAPELDALRVHAERLRADADVIDANARVAVAGTELARWMGAVDGSPLRASDAPVVPDPPPALAGLLARLEESAPVRREVSDVRAAEARADRERALVRPSMALDLGADAYDPAFPGALNYRAQLTVDVPLFNQRGPFIERERALADAARARTRAARLQVATELTTAYRTFEAASARQRTAERVLVDTRMSALEARAAQANAWADVEHALGTP